MKETYVAPELEVVEFDCEDVITTTMIKSSTDFTAKVE